MTSGMSFNDTQVSVSTDGMGVLESSNNEAAVGIPKFSWCSLRDDPSTRHEGRSKVGDFICF